MNLYLTNANISVIDSGGNSPQVLPSNSLGGFISSTLVPNNSLNELFDIISKTTLSEGAVETVGICLKNNLDNVAKAKIKILTDNLNIGKYKIAVVEIDEEAVMMEKIQTRYDLPQNGEFVNVDLYKASVDVNIVTCGKVGEEFTILPFGISGEILEPTYDGVYNAVKLAFVEFKEYEVRRLNEKNFRIERVDETIDEFDCELVTTDSLELSFSGKFKNAVDNTGYISEEPIENGKMYGIWIQREIQKETPMPDADLIAFYENKNVIEILEKVELIIEYDLLTTAQQ